MRGGITGEEIRRAAFRVAHDQHVHLHGFEILQRVQQGFALARRGRADLEVQHVGREALGGQLEGHARAGARLEEQVDDRLAPQQRHLLDRALADRQERFGQVQNGNDLCSAQAIDGQQMAQRRAFKRSRSHHGQTANSGAGAIAADRARRV